MIKMLLTVLINRTSWFVQSKLTVKSTIVNIFRLKKNLHFYTNQFGCFRKLSSVKGYVYII